MSSREEKLSQIREHIKELDKEITMILQSLQWDRKQLLQTTSMTICKYNTNHKVPIKNKKKHEDVCGLKSQGYAKDDIFLPDAFDITANTIVKFSPDNIKEIINYASKVDPQFKKGNTDVVSEPLTAERLQASYTADERRAIHDAVVNAVSSSRDLSDSALTRDVLDPAVTERKSKLEILAELRDMKRRRTRYRVAVPTRNYSHVLRDVIGAQMDMLKEVQGDIKNKMPPDEPNKRKFNDEEDNLKTTSSNISLRKTQKLERTVIQEAKINYVENKKRNHNDDNSRHTRKDENRDRDRKRISFMGQEKKDKRYDKYREHNRKVAATRESYNERSGSIPKYDRYENKTWKSDTNRNLNINYECDEYNCISRDRQRYHTNERKRYSHDKPSKNRLKRDHS